VTSTANPELRAKRPPDVMGNTIGILVTRLNGSGEITNTGRLPCCSCPKVGSKERDYHSLPVDGIWLPESGSKILPNEDE